MEENGGLSTSPNINSVLKPPKPRIPLGVIMAAVQDEDNTADRKRRVSFANVNKVKEFSAGAESMVVCHTPAYEEPFYISSDSSYPSGADGWTPAKNMLSVSTDSNNIQALIRSELKEQFPPHLNPDNFSGTGHEINENRSFQNLQRQSLPKSRLSGLSTQDNNTVFGTSYNSFDAMNLTKCIDNRQSMAKNSTKLSLGMDFTGCVNNFQNATDNATRFSLGMDMTNVVGKSVNTMSLSSEGMDLTKAVNSHEPYTDQSSHHIALCSNFSDGVSLDDSNALELTDAINDPRLSAMSMLYSVSNTGFNKKGKHSVPDKTRYSLSGMDLTKAAISNCSSARRKSTKYSLSNMELTEVVKAGDWSGLDLTESINDPKIVAMSTRYSVNEMDFTDGLVFKDNKRFSTNSIESSGPVEGMLDYSAGSEASMDFTKPIHNILQPHHQTDSPLSSNPMESSAIFEETEGRKSSCSSAHIKLQDIYVNKELNELSSKTNPLIPTNCTVNSFEKVENNISVQNNKENIIYEPILSQQLNSNNSHFQNSPVFQTQLSNENVCTAVTTKQFAPEIKQVEEVFDGAVMDAEEVRDKEFSLTYTNNSSCKIDLPLRSSSETKSVEDNCFKTSMLCEKNLKSNEISTSCKKLQECKATVSDTTFKADERLKVADISYENMEVSDMDSSQYVQSNNLSKKGNNFNPFSVESALKSAEEASTSFSLEIQPGNVSTVHSESMETSALENSVNLIGPSLLEVSQLYKSDCAPVSREDTHNGPDKKLIESSTVQEEHAQSNISVECIGNNVEREPLNVEIKLMPSFYGESTSLQTKDLINTATVEEGNIELENRSSCSLSKELPTPEINMDENNVDNSLNASQDYQMANVSVDGSWKLGGKPSEGNNTLFMCNYKKNETSQSLQQSQVDESIAPAELYLSSDNLANVSASDTLCPKNITMTRGGATRHSTVFSVSHSSSEVSKSEDSLIGHNMEQTSVLESLPLIQRIAMSGDASQNLSEVQPEKKETSDACKKGGKRSFEEALKPEDDTKESPLKQLCLSKGDCDLLINVTAPSFLMDTINLPNETLHHVSDNTLMTSRVVSPVKTQTCVELTVEKQSVFENIELKEPSMSFVQKKNLDDLCDNGFSLRVDISTDYDSSKIIVQKESKNISVKIDDHVTRTLETSDYPTQKTITKPVANSNVPSSQCKTVQNSSSPPESPMGFEPTYCKIRSKSKSVGSSLSLRNKHKEPTSGVGSEEYLSGRHSMALPKLTSLSQQKEMDSFRKNKKIRNLSGAQFVCDIIPKWLEFHFVSDSSGNIMKPSYKIVCAKQEQAVGEYLLQQVKTDLPPRNASDLLNQLQGPVCARLATLARILSLICKYYNGTLKGNILTVELMNCKKHFWIFVDINIKYPQNLTMTDITISHQRIGELKLAQLRQIFDSVSESPEQLLQYAKELTKLQWD